MNPKRCAIFVAIVLIGSCADNGVDPRTFTSRIVDDARVALSWDDKGGSCAIGVKLPFLDDSEEIVTFPIGQNICVAARETAALDAVPEAR